MSKLLAEGGFGCVYYPGFKCSGKSDPEQKHITKLHVKNYTSYNEIYIGNKLQTITDYFLYFIPIIKNCDIKLASIDKKMIKDCNIINDNKNLVLMKSQYINNLDFFTFILKKKHTKTEIFMNMVQSYQYLLTSIQKLHNKNIIHYDLKNDNIIFNNDTNLPLIIDFGLSLDMSKLNSKNITEFFYIYAADYYIWTPEIHLISYLVQKRLDPKSVITKDELTRVANKSVNNNKALKIFSENFINNFKQLTVQYFLTFENNTKKEILEQLITPYIYKTWDNYALSILYLRCFEYIFSNGFTNSTLLLDMSQILLENINPVPSKRNSINKTSEQINELLKSKLSKDNLKGIIESISINADGILRDNLKRRVISS